VLCRTLEQVRACLEHCPWLIEITIDFLEAQGLREAVRAVQAAGVRAVVATPRILKPAESKLVQFYLRLRADALLVRSVGMLQALGQYGAKAGGPLHLPGTDQAAMPYLCGDFSLNAANVLSAARFLAAGAGLARLTPAHDMNADQLAALARSVGPAAARRLEVIVHSHLPLFHTEHCVFARMLSTGNSIADCGQPCERHSVSLQSPSGEMHAVLADAGCRNTVFNGAPQSGAEYVRQLADAGVGGLRVELLSEAAEEVPPLLYAYRDVLAGDGRARAALRWLQARGTVRGSLEPRAERARADMKPTAASLKA
jgi:collagenase-like PrtC family protease